MMISKFLDPKNDFAFKRIFGAEKNIHILIHFLNDILNRHLEKPIKQLTFLKTVQDPEIASKKQSIVDVLCKDEEGKQYIVEMQVATIGGFEKRAHYYAAKAYVNQMKNGEGYKNLKEIIFLAIVNFVMFPEKKEYQSNHRFLDIQTHHNDLKDFSFCFLKLPKFNVPIEKLKTSVERWAYFFKHASETKESDLDQISGNDFAIKEAYEQLNQFSWSEIELRTYEQEKKREKDAQAIILNARQEGEEEGFKKGKKEGLQEGLKEGLQEGLKEGLQEGLKEGLQEGLKEGLKKRKKEGLKEGMEKGKKKAKQELAKALLAEGMSPEKISSLTGLKRDEILILRA